MFFILANLLFVILRVVAPISFADLSNCRVYTTSDNPICLECQQGYVLLDTSNIICVDISTWNCTTSANYTGCLTCPLGYNLEFNFFNTSLQGCIPCQNSTCYSCNQGSCITCKTSELLAYNPSNSEVYCQDITLFNCSTSLDYTGCITCLPGFGLHSNFSNTTLQACSPCFFPNCTSCNENYIMCTQCSNSNSILANFSNSSVYCQDLTGFNCANEKDYIGCDDCYLGTGFKFDYENTGLQACLKCQDLNCDDCGDDYQACRNCRFPFSIFAFTTNSSTYCQDISTFNCLTYQDYIGCLTCLQGYSIEPNFTNTTLQGCLSCLDPYCADCSSDLQKCITCKPNALLAINPLTNATYCQEVTLFNCSGSLDDYLGCITCPSGFGLYSNFSNTTLQACSPCLFQNCTSCSENYAKCTQCNNNSILANLPNNSIYCQDLTGFNCLTYQDYVGCLTCPRVTGLHPNFANTTLQSCSPCLDLQCDNCSSDYEESCNTCEPNQILAYDLTNSTSYCHDISTFNCHNEVNYIGCTSCPDGLGLMASFSNTMLQGCVPCFSQNCTLCNGNYEVCTQCNYGILVESKNNSVYCQDVSQFHCHIAEDYVGCSSCSNGFGKVANFLNSSLQGCLPCQLEYCGDCFDDYEVCVECNNMSIFVKYSNGSSYCQDIISYNCLDSKDYIGCLSCLPRTGMNMDIFDNPNMLRQCLACLDPNCDNCYGNYRECASCGPDEIFARNSSGSSGFNSVGSVNDNSGSNDIGSSEQDNTGNIISFNNSGSYCQPMLNFNCANKADYIGCTSCPPGFGFHNNFLGTNLKSCSPCLFENCTSCMNDYQTCTECSNGILVNQTVNASVYCQSLSSLNCLLVENYIGCTSCSSGFGLDINFLNSNLQGCSPCEDMNCANCSEDYHICNACKDFSIFANSPYGPSYCQNITSFNCITSQDYVGCLNCSVNSGIEVNFQGTTLQGCSPCQDLNCISCSQNYQNCLQCNNDSILINGPSGFTNCQNISDFNCTKFSNYTGCITCSEGFGFNKNYLGGTLQACSPCKDPNCALCYNDYQVCDSCKKPEIKVIIVTKNKNTSSLDSNDDNSSLNETSQMIFPIA